jgi:predicted DCC family thiol-disulfide oxidoreductase YuxK
VAVAGGGVFLLVPRPVRDAAYRFVARHRAKFAGPADACALPAPEQAERFFDR